MGHLGFLLLTTTLSLKTTLCIKPMMKTNLVLVTNGIASRIDANLNTATKRTGYANLSKALLAAMHPLDGARCVTFSQLIDINVF